MTKKPYWLTIDLIKSTIDEDSGATKEISVSDANAIDWLLFSAYSFEAVPSSWYSYTQIKTGASQVAFKISQIICATNTYFTEFIESPTITDWTTLIPCINLNRASTLETDVVIYADPTETSGGTILEIFYTPAEKASVWADSEMASYWILEPNTSYLIKSQNQWNWTTSLLIKMYWFAI